MVASLQRSLKECEEDGKGVGRQAKMLKRDKNMLKKSLFKVFKFKKLEFLFYTFCIEIINIYFHQILKNIRTI